MAGGMDVLMEPDPYPWRVSQRGQMRQRQWQRSFMTVGRSPCRGPARRQGKQPRGRGLGAGGGASGTGEGGASLRPGTRLL